MAKKQKPRKPAPPPPVNAVISGKDSEQTGASRTWKSPAILAPLVATIASAIIAFAGVVYSTTTKREEKQPLPSNAIVQVYAPISLPATNDNLFPPRAAPAATEFTKRQTAALFTLDQLGTILAHKGEIIVRELPPEHAEEVSRQLEIIRLDVKKPDATLLHEDTKELNKYLETNAPAVYRRHGPLYNPAPMRIGADGKPFQHELTKSDCLQLGPYERQECLNYLIHK